jgi:hypothetical protein
MRWGPVQSTSLVCFTGSDSPGVSGLILTGSRRHVLSESPFIGDNSGFSGSQMDAVFWAYDALAKQDWQRDSSRFDPLEGRETAYSTYRLWDFLNGRIARRRPEQRLEFFAVPLVEYHKPERGFHSPQHLVVGTPLYVAVAREPESETSAGS